MSDLVLKCMLFAVSFLLLFVVGELLYHKLNVRSEFTRKFTHIGGAFITLLFPIFLGNHWAVLILSCAFAGILFITQKFNLLQSVHSVKRITFGGFLFPAAIYMSYLAFEYCANLTYYYLPVLILALCDPAAALTGQAYPWKPIKIGSETKTLAGVLAFFGLSMLLCLGWFIFFSSTTRLEIILVSLCVSLFASIIELLSKKGLDNVTIPIVVILTLYLFNV